MKEHWKGSSVTISQFLTLFGIHCYHSCVSYALPAIITSSSDIQSLLLLGKWQKAIICFLKDTKMLYLVMLTTYRLSDASHYFSYINRVGITF